MNSVACVNYTGDVNLVQYFRHKLQGVTGHVLLPLDAATASGQVVHIDVQATWRSNARCDGWGRNTGLS